MYLLQHCINPKGNSCCLNNIPTHPAPQNAGQYFELPSSGQGVSSQPEAYEHDGGNTLYNSAAGF
ncbi:hypothetical protein C9083_25415 [Escherichia coli]|nr:hypothetical protein C9084_25610 [Escherichia coli]TJK88257.1 hypothetical protein C9083_25415 [Escherichia coli]